MTQLAICYTQPGQRPQYVALVEDERLLRRAAQLAVEQAEFRAAAVSSDDTARRLHAVEVGRLRAALTVLVPGFSDSSNTESAIQ
jgi:hypothetical protein